ncbi:MAG: hypothetical protein JNM56_02265 [Planctomycetia bacterium]|nr:hypothetical protein [Planctomycetia bacterium]
MEFTVVNEGRQPYYVFTCAAGGLREPLPHRAYTAYSDADQALHLLLGLPPVPPGSNVFARIVPLSTFLQPGDRHADFLDIPLPVPEWQPYLPENTQDVEIVEARRLRLATEYFSHASLFRPPEWDHQFFFFRAFGGESLPVSATLELDEPLSVLKRRDRFERF